MSAGNGTTPLRNPLVRGRNGVLSPDGKYIISTANGLWKYHGETKIWGRSGSGGYAEVNQDGEIFASAGDHVNKYDRNGNLVWSSGSLSGANTANISALALVKKYTFVLYTLSNGTYLWPGVALFDPSGNLVWSDVDGNAPNNVTFNFKNIAVDRSGGLWAIADYRHSGNSTLVLQRRSIKNHFKTQFIIDSPAISIDDADFSFDYYNNYMAVAMTDGAFNSTIYRYDVINGAVLSSVSLGGSSNKMNHNITITPKGIIYFSPGNTKVYKINSTVDSIKLVQNEAYSIAGVQADTDGNYFVLMGYQDYGGIDHWVVKEYANDDVLKNSVDVQSQGSKPYRVSAMPGNPSILFGTLPPGNPSSVHVQINTTNINITWDYLSPVAAVFTVFINGVQVTDNLTAENYTYNYSGTPPKSVGIQAVSGLGKLSNVTFATPPPSNAQYQIYYTNKYVNRVLAAGGEITDGTYISDFIGKCLGLGIWSNLVLAVDPNFGLSKNDLGGIGTLYDLSNQQNDAISGSARPVFQLSSLMKAASLWNHSDNDQMLITAQDLIDSTGLFVLNHGSASAQMVLMTSTNLAQIRETGTDFELNGGDNLGGPTISIDTQQWHIAHSQIKKASYAKVGANGIWGTQKSMTSTTWPVNRFGYYSGGSSYNWDGQMAGIYLFNSQLSDAVFTEFLDFLNAYYGIF